MPRLKEWLLQFWNNEDSQGSPAFLVIAAVFFILYGVSTFAVGETEIFLESLLSKIIIPFLVLCAVMIPIAIARIRKARSKDRDR